MFTFITVLFIIYLYRLSRKEAKEGGKYRDENEAYMRESRWWHFWNDDSDGYTYPGYKSRCGRMGRS